MRIVITKQRYYGDGEMVLALTSDDVVEAMSFVVNANRAERRVTGQPDFIFRAFVINDNGVDRDGQMLDTGVGFELETQEDALPAHALRRGGLESFEVAALPVRPLEPRDLIEVG